MFRDAEGVPLNMQSFELIDFGAISYKEIFQNAKTILATTIMSAALERTLGVDARIVDLPISDAAQATVALMQALYFWEPRIEVMDIDFEADVINGHLITMMQLRVRNVIFGTDTPYTSANIFSSTPTKVTQELPPMNVPIPGPPGPIGPTGQRGSLWFVGATDPPEGGFGEGAPALQAQDMYLNTTSGDVFQWSAPSPTVASRWVKTRTSS
jgi:phage baseplate assembly protein W